MLSTGTRLTSISDYIIQYNIKTYFSDDMDRRQHDYFRRRDSGWPAIGGDRILLTAAQFMQDFYASHNDVQKAIRMLSCFSLRGEPRLTRRSDNLCSVGPAEHAQI